MYIKRSSGAKLLFYDVKGDGAKIQVMADLRCWISGKLSAFRCTDTLQVPGPESNSQ